MMDYAGPHQPTYIGFSTSCNILRTVQERAHAIMLDQNYFLPCVEQLVQDVVQENGGIVGQRDIKPDIINIINNYNFSLRLTDCDGSSTEADPVKNEIHYNANWMAYADQLSIGSGDYKNTFSLALVKYFHEFANLLTPKILELDVRGSNKPKQSIPQKIGTKQENIHGKNFWMGDMGFRLEEIMFGARISGDYVEESWEIKNLIAEKLVYDPDHANNLQFAKFHVYSIIPEVLNQFKKQLSEGYARNRLRLNDQDLKIYEEVASTSSKKRKHAPILTPTLDPKGNGGHGGAFLDMEFFQKHGVVEKHPKDKNIKR